MGSVVAYCGAALWGLDLPGGFDGVPLCQGFSSGEYDPLLSPQLPNCGFW